LQPEKIHYCVQTTLATRKKFVVAASLATAKKKTLVATIFTTDFFSETTQKISITTPHN
jgi:hypothetical protein